MKLIYSFIPFAVASTFLIVACGDDNSSTNVSAFPDEVAGKAELNTYDCNMSVIGKKVFVTDLGKNYECDGEEWFESYEQPKSSAKGKNSSSSGKVESSSSAKSSSSRSTEVLKPEIKVEEHCTEEMVGACDGMIKSDVSTWHFVRKDDFGDDAEYTYKVDGRDLIVTIKNADGSTSSNTYTMYNMESEVGVEMAYRAAKATCEDGAGSATETKTCVKDTVLTMPECTQEREGVFGIDTAGTKLVCHGSVWRVQQNFDYGELTDERDGRTYYTVKIGKQEWMAENLNFKTEKSSCYDNDSSNCAKYGRLYSWAAAMDSAGQWSKDSDDCGYGKFCSLYPVRGVCPSGWHLPSVEDWRTLYSAVEKDSTSIVLRSIWGWNGDKNGVDKYGFSVLPGGYFYQGVETPFSDVGDEGYFWSSVDEDSSWAEFVSFDSYKDFQSGLKMKFCRLSVRCVRNDSTYVDLNDLRQRQSSSSKSASSVEVVSPLDVVRGSLTDDRDGQVYKTVAIGSQTWMAENLNYDNDDHWRSKAGFLYKWSDAMDGRGEWSKNGVGCFNQKKCRPVYPVRGICPSGWHLPVIEEWEILFKAVGGSDVAGEMLKSATDRTDDYGFSALYAGYQQGAGGRNTDEDEAAYFWSATEKYDYSYEAKNVFVGKDSDAVSEDWQWKAFYLSVRCVKDE